MPEYVSASQIKKFDDTDDNGCQRRWGFRYILGIPDPAGAGAELGGKVHQHLENFLGKGQVFPNDRAGKLAYQLLDYCIEVRGRPGLEIEGDFHHKEDGVYYFGKVDVRLRHPSGFSWIRDWKTSSDPVRYGLRVDNMLDDHQAVLYAHQELARTGEDRVMLDWVYVKTKPPKINPFATRAQFTKAAVDAVWPRTHAVGLAIEEAKATVADPNDLRPHRTACHAYGKACPYIDMCHGAADPTRIIQELYASKSSATPSIVPVAALTAKATEPEQKQETQKEQPMTITTDPATLLANRRARQGRQAPVAAAPAAPAAPAAAAPAPAPVARPQPDVIAEPGPVPVLQTTRPGLDPAKAQAAYAAQEAAAAAATPAVPVTPPQAPAAPEPTAQADERASRVNAPEAVSDDPQTQTEASRLLAIVIEANPGRGKAKEAREAYQQKLAEGIASGLSVEAADLAAKEAAGLDGEGKRIDAKKAKKAKAAVTSGAVHPSDAWLRIYATVSADHSLTADQLDEEVNRVYKRWAALFGGA